MNWLFDHSALTTTFIGALFVVLLVQGIALLRRADKPTGQPIRRWLGWLTILLVGLGGVAYGLFALNMLVFSPELGVVMVQGSLAWYILAAIIFGSAMSIAMGLQVVCLAAGQTRQERWLMGVAAVVGLVSVALLQPLSKDMPAAQIVYIYDLWSPPLLLWLVVGLAGAVGFCFGCGGPRRREWLWVATFALVSLVIWAVNSNDGSFVRSILDSSRVPVETIEDLSQVEKTQALSRSFWLVFCLIGGIGGASISLALGEPRRRAWWWATTFALINLALWAYNRPDLPFVWALWVSFLPLFVLVNMISVTLLAAQGINGEWGKAYRWVKRLAISGVGFVGLVSATGAFIGIAMPLGCQNADYDFSLWETEFWQALLALMTKAPRFLIDFLRAQTIFIDLASSQEQCTAWTPLPAMWHHPPLTLALSFNNDRNLAWAWAWGLWLSWSVLALLLASAGRLIHIWRNQENHQSRWQSLQGGGWRWLLLIGLAAFGPSLARLIYELVMIGPASALTLFVLVWLLLTTMATNGPPYRYQNLAKIWNAIRYKLKAFWDWTGALAQKAVGAGGWLKNLFSLPTVTVALVKALGALAILLALSELPNAGKTIFEPFSAPLVADGDNLGRAISTHTLIAFRLLHQQYQTQIILPRLRQGTEFGNQTSPSMDRENISQLPLFVSATDGMGSTAAALSSNDLEFAGVKIPFGMLIAPIQRPVRALIGVRVIAGSVQVDHGRYQVWAKSTDGEFWRAEFPPRSVDLLLAGSDGIVRRQTVPLLLASELPENLPSPVITLTVALSTVPVTLTSQILSHVGIAPEGVVQLIGIAPESAALLKAPIAVVIGADRLVAVINPISSAQDVVADLAEEIAFRIKSSDPTFAATGMTKSWAAFQPFRYGIERMESFRTDQDYNALADAIELLREATHQDPNFALAHYRLGLALQADGQPGAAEAAFQASIAANPAFIAAYNALAYDLYHFQSYYNLPTSIGSKAPISSEEVQNTRRRTARQIWQQIMTLPHKHTSSEERAVAYAGLCDLGKHIPNTFVQATNYLHYFYCYQAQRAYIALSPELRVTASIRQSEAVMLWAMGTTLFWIDGKQRNSVQSPQNESDPSCRTRDRGNHYFDRATLWYFQHAAALQPNDQFLRCEVAYRAYVLSDLHPMKELTATKASYYVIQAQTVTKEAAVKSYQKALAIEPSNIDALSGYVRIVLACHRSAVNPKPPACDVQQAEQYARKLLSTTAGNGSRAAEANYRHLLGQVLLLNRKLTEALKELEHAAALAPANARFDEIRWNFVQESLCRDSFQDPIEQWAMQEKARFYLRQIKHNEQHLEYQPFGALWKESTNKFLLDWPQDQDLSCSRLSRFTSEDS